MPAEWERHEATWIGWPHNSDDWPGKFAAIPWVYAEIVRKIAPGERLRILINDQKHESRAGRILKKAGIDSARVDFLQIPTDRGWTRDFGPIFARNDGEKTIVDFKFNAWARYSNWRKDNDVPDQAALSTGHKIFKAEHNHKHIVMEGGAIDVNGRGTLITTEECLLDPEIQTRNPGLGRKDYETVFKEWLGITNTIWLGKGISGDDTHGHVDDLCRFVNTDTIVVVDERNSNDANYYSLQENRERLQDARLEEGQKPAIAELPMPDPLYFEGHRLPASYANFYISNSAVLVPTFNDANDRTALGILSELISDRPVIGIHAVDLVWGFGTLHCLTQQEPYTCKADTGTI